VVEETLIIGPMIVDLLGGVCREDRFEPVHPRGVCDALNCIQIKHNFFFKNEGTYQPEIQAWMIRVGR